MTVLRKAPESKFAYVMVASRRARQLMAGARPLLDQPSSQKATRNSMAELDRGYLEYDMPELAGFFDEPEEERR
jgi:DNA-directed RNA polymerase omega subunit